MTKIVAGVARLQEPLQELPNFGESDYLKVRHDVGRHDVGRHDVCYYGRSEAIKISRSPD